MRSMAQVPPIDQPTMPQSDGADAVPNRETT